MPCVYNSYRNAWHINKCTCYESQLSDRVTGVTVQVIAGSVAGVLPTRRRRCTNTVCGRPRTNQRGQSVGRARLGPPVAPLELGLKHTQIPFNHNCNQHILKTISTLI